MSLKTDYQDGATGLTEKMNAAFDAGIADVVANLAVISTGLKDAAARGETKFKVQISPSYEPANLRLKTRLAATYLDGVGQGLANEDIYIYECIPVLNEADQINLKLDLEFDFSSDPTVSSNS